VIPREGVESNLPPVRSTGKVGGYVIPREGVESFVLVAAPRILMT